MKTTGSLNLFVLDNLLSTSRLQMKALYQSKTISCLLIIEKWYTKENKIVELDFCLFHRS
jgi:hypothetical protein